MKQIPITPAWSIRLARHRDGQIVSCAICKASFARRRKWCASPHHFGLLGVLRSLWFIVRHGRDQEK